MARGGKLKRDLLKSWKEAYNFCSGGPGPGMYHGTELERCRAGVQIMLEHTARNMKVRIPEVGLNGRKGRNR